MGGILSNGKSAFGHLATTGEKMVEFFNAVGSDVPGTGNIVSGYNYVGNVLLPSSSTKERIKNVKDAAGHYGQEATKFYAGTGGGEAERMAASKNVAPEYTSGQEQAGFLQTEKELMLERFRQKENQIRQELGQDFLDRHPVMTPDVHEAVRRIDKSIAKLRGENGEVAGSSGVPREVKGLPISEQMRAAPDGSIVRWNNQRLVKQGGKWQPIQ
jgi:hypothetical protein